jgi:hypothetical protein
MPQKGIEPPTNALRILLFAIIYEIRHLFFKIPKFIPMFFLKVNKVAQEALQSSSSSSSSNTSKEVEAQR